MKSYTDLNQSKKLAEILHLETADMALCGKIQPLMTDYISAKKNFSNAGEIPIDPCWSLAALLSVLSKWAECVNEEGIAELSYEKVTKWCVSMLNCGKIKDCYADNPIDACYEMIIKLNEQKLL